MDAQVHVHCGPRSALLCAFTCLCFSALHHLHSRCNNGPILLPHLSQISLSQLVNSIMVRRMQRHFQLNAHASTRCSKCLLVNASFD
uniref:Putative secreted protein n=1 Tax=Rhipicephalus microplus TaxID=6941 RepID=A0A6G5A2K8_RHIMP